MTIEVAHLYLSDPTLTYDKVMSHITACNLVLNSIDISHRALMVMVDDQKIKHKARANETLPFISIVLRHMPIDYICYETDLNHYKHEWLAQQTNSVELYTSIKKDYNGCPQCSHYIAIWYLLRFGRIKDTCGIMLPVSRRAISGNIMPADLDHLTSILPSQYKEVEDQTQTGILDKLLVPLKPIERIYYG